MRRLPNAKVVPGYREQRRAFKEGPDDPAGSDDITPQWCFPLRRQHAGRFNSGLEAKSNPIIGEIVTARSKTAILRRKSAFYTHRELGGKSHVERRRSTLTPTRVPGHQSKIGWQNKLIVPVARGEGR